MKWLLFLLTACSGLSTFDETETDSSDSDSADTDSADTDTDTDTNPPNNDMDGDGIPDDVEGKDAPGGPTDTDGDGTPDYLDTDSDGDNLPDAAEAQTSTASAPPDSDGDGIPDWRDLDSDNDAIPDGQEGFADVDGDGIVDYLDPRNDVAAPQITLIGISTTFNAPIGIDVHDPTHTVVMSVNYPTGGPVLLERVESDGTHASFSSIQGFTNEVKIATARTGNPGGFQAGDLFVGNGTDGQIARVDAGGLAFDNPWVQLPGASVGLMRGSLYIDRTGVFGGDLLAATTTGQVWRITASAVPTLLADVPGVHLEGLMSVPDAPARYGPLAGTVIAGAEGEGLMYAFKPDGSYQTYSLGVNIEDIDMVVPGENFFGVNYGTSKLLGAVASDFQTINGDILLTQESHANVGLYRLYWNGTALVADELLIHANSATVGQWEHVTFANAGIVEVEATP